MSVWKASVMTPYAAPIDSRFTSTALTGTTIDRNASTISTNDVASTTETMTHRFDDSRSVKSVIPGVLPPSSAPAGSSARIRSSSAMVASSCGPSVGVTVMTAAEPSGETCAGDTEATPSVAARSSASASIPAVPPTLLTSIATSSGAFAPGPKPSATRSYAWRMVVDSASLPASALPSFMPSAGAASARSRTSEPSSQTTGRPETVRASRAAAGECEAADSKCPDRRVLRL